MKIKDILSLSSKRLKKISNCERTLLESELLLSFFLKKDRIFLHLNDNYLVKNYLDFLELLKRRENNEPLEYITGKVNFYSLDFKISQPVLIPRPETEILIDEVSKIIENDINIKNIAEIGIGSGIISILLAKKFPHLNFIATDISTEAIKLAKENIKKYNLESKIKVIESNLIDEINSDIDLVVSNPPYISNSYKLEEHIIKFESKKALFGGIVGDELIKKIILDVKKRDIKYLIVEMGYDQKNSLKSFLIKNEIKKFSFFKDLSNLDRGLSIILK